MPKTQLEHPTWIYEVCPNGPVDTISRTHHAYKDNKLIRKTEFISNLEPRITEYTYEDNRLRYEVRYRVYRVDSIIYSYNASGQLALKELKGHQYDSNSPSADPYYSKIEYEYKDNFLVKETPDWGGYKSYEYKNDILVKRIDHKSDGAPHQITYFENIGYNVARQWSKTASGHILYDYRNIYDPEMRLITKMDGKNIIERNTYDGNKLISKTIYIYGFGRPHPCGRSRVFYYTYE